MDEIALYSTNFESYQIKHVHALRFQPITLQKDFTHNQKIAGLLRMPKRDINARRIISFSTTAVI